MAVLFDGHSYVSPADAVPTRLQDLPGQSIGQAVNPDNATSSIIVNNLPIISVTKTSTATLAPSYFDLFYNKIHLIPKKLELGNVASVQARQQLVWNAFTIPKNLSSFLINNGSGINVTQPQVPPFDIKSLEILTYSVNVTLDGDPNINADLQWTIDGLDYQVPITGSRISAFFFRHNWQKSYKETWTFLTSVIRRRDSTEQRSRLRIKPRKTLQYEALITGNDHPSLNNVLHAWQARAFAVPLWMDEAETTTDIIIGGLTLDIDTTDISLYSGVLVAIFTDTSNFELIEVKSYIGSTVTFSNGTTNAWLAKSKLVVINTGRLKQQQQIIQYTDKVSKIVPVFDCATVGTETGFSGVAAPVLYNTKELWVNKFNWSRVRNNQSKTEYDVIDSLTGANRYFEKIDFNAQVKIYNYTLLNRTEIRLFKEFIERRAGKAIPFYIPTFDDDFTLVSTIGVAATVINVLDNDYRNFVEAHGARNNIYIETKDGSIYVNKILSTLDNGNGTQRLSLENPIPDEIFVQDIKQISILLYARLASDKVIFTYLSTDKCQVSISVQALKEWI